MLPNKGAPEGSRRFSCCRGTQRGIGRLSSHFAGKRPAKWLKCECARELTALSNKHVLIRRVSINFSNWNPFSYFFFFFLSLIVFFPLSFISDQFFDIFHYLWFSGTPKLLLRWNMVAFDVAWESAVVSASWLALCCSLHRQTSGMWPNFSMQTHSQLEKQLLPQSSCSLHTGKNAVVPVNQLFPPSCKAAAVTWRPQDIVSGNSACAISSLCCISRAAIFHCHPFWWYLEQKGLPTITFWVNS